MVTQKLSETKFRAYSTHSRCESFANYTLPYPFVPTFNLPDDEGFSTSYQGLRNMYELFTKIFLTPKSYPNWMYYTIEERKAVIASQISSDLFDLVGGMLMDPLIPITKNFICYVLKLSVQLYGTRPGAQQIDVAIQALQKTRHWSRRQISDLLADAAQANWLSDYWAVKLQKFWIKNPNLAELIVMTAWLKIEPIGSYWHNSFAYLHLWAYTLQDELVPMVIPSLLSFLVNQFIAMIKLERPLYTRLMSLPVCLLPLQNLFDIDPDYKLPFHFLLPQRAAFDTLCKPNEGKHIFLYNKTFENKKILCKSLLKMRRKDCEL